MSFCEVIITLQVRHFNIRCCQRSLECIVIVAIVCLFCFAECKFYTERVRGKLVFGIDKGAINNENRNFKLLKVMQHDHSELVHIPQYKLNNL